jgi:hypothetical protein
VALTDFFYDEDFDAGAEGSWELQEADGAVGGL